MLRVRFYTNLTKIIYVTASQSARDGHLGRQAQCPQALRAHGTSQEARPVERRRPHHGSAQDQTGGVSLGGSTSKISGGGRRGFASRRRAIYFGWARFGKWQ